MEENDDADEANIIPQIILIIVLTFVNAFFASAELAVLSVNRSKIKRLASEGNKRAKAVEKLCSDETKFFVYYSGWNNFSRILFKCYSCCCDF